MELPSNLAGRFLVAFTAGAIASVAAAQQPSVGAPLPPWTPGTVDIHQISTGRGNAAFWILADGTTLLLDAGGVSAGLPQTELHPDGSRSPAEWITRYLKRHMPDSMAPIDYAVVTHFHPDHYGALVAVGRAVGFRAIIDRGWPDYSYPASINDSMMATYRRFLDSTSAHGASIQRFRPGEHDQIRLTHDAARFPSIAFQNIIANGDVWTGVGEKTRALFPPLRDLPHDDYPNENMCSAGLRFSYGAFRYFTGGDLPGSADPGFPAWHSIEPAIAGAIGRVDVQVVNQHGSIGEETEPYLEALASTVYIVPAWSATHPAPDVMKRIVNSRFAPRERFVFTTDERDATRIVLAQRANAFAGPPGHVIVRVEPGGSRYWVIVTTNADETDRVMAVRGPFTAGARP